MPLTCPRCGTPSPDGNQFCQSCGTPLAAPAGVTTGVIPGPPPGPPPNFAAPPPAAYQSPYYTPSGAVAPVHRTPWMLIVAGVALLTLLMAGAGTALALLNHGTTSANTGGLGDVTSPTPGVTPSPVASPTTTSTTPGAVSNDGFSLTLPSGWAVESKDNESVVLTDPNTEGSVTIASGVSIPTQTAQQNKDTVDGALKSKYPDTQECPNTKPTNTTLNGAAGISWMLCFTLTQGANSLPAALSMFAGANPSGTVYYFVMVLSTQSNIQSYVNIAKPVVQSVHWKLS